MQRTLLRIQRLMVRRTQKAFDDQGRPPGTWKERHVPNIAGMLSDLEKPIRDFPKRRWEARPAAQDVGLLKVSIAALSYVKGTTVIYGSALPYASKVQRGIASVIAITAAMRKNLAAILKRHKEYRANLGFLFQLTTYEVKPPARPFVLFLPEDAQDVRQIVRTELLGQRGGGTAVVS